MLIDSGVVSHYCWLDCNRYVVWGRKKDGRDGYFLGDVFDLSLIPLSVSELSQGDGHPSRIDNKSFVSIRTQTDLARLRFILRMWSWASRSLSL